MFFTYAGEQIHMDGMKSEAINLQRLYNEWDWSYVATFSFQNWACKHKRLLHAQVHGSRWNSLEAKRSWWELPDTSCNVNSGPRLAGASSLALGEVSCEAVRYSEESLRKAVKVHATMWYLVVMILNASGREMCWHFEALGFSAQGEGEFSGRVCIYCLGCQMCGSQKLASAKAVQHEGRQAMADSRKQGSKDKSSQRTLTYFGETWATCHQPNQSIGAI